MEYHASQLTQEDVELIFCFIDECIKKDKVKETKKKQLKTAFEKYNSFYFFGAVETSAKILEGVNLPEKKTPLEKRVDALKNKSASVFQALVDARGKALKTLEKRINDALVFCGYIKKARETKNDLREKLDVASRQLLCWKKFVELQTDKTIDVLRIADDELSLTYYRNNKAFNVPF